MKSNQAKILLVDDDPTVLLTLEAVFRDAGYDIVSTRSPGEAVALAERSRPDCIVLDVVMPELSGWEVLEELRGRASLDATPVILLSSLEKASDRVRGLRAGAEDFIVKPFDKEELVARVETQLSRRARGSSGLHGLFEIQPIQELVQSLENNSKTGELHVYAGGVAGCARLREGKVVSAAWAGYEGQMAVQAVLELKSGQFRFAPGDVEGPADVVPFSFFPLLMQAAWVDDELTSRHEHLPPPAAPLQTCETNAQIPQGLARLPAHLTYAHLHEHPGTTLEELVAQRIDVPRSVELAVAWLRELGMIETSDVPQLAAELPDLLDGALRTLFFTAAGRGFPPEELAVRFLVEPGAWESLAALLEGIDDAWLHPAEQKTKGRIFRDQGGALRLYHESGRLTLSFEGLREDHEDIARAGCVVLWLGNGTAPADLELPALHAFASDASLVCAAPNARSRKRAEGKLGRGSGWMYLDYLPQTLQDLLLVLTLTTV